MGFWKTFTDFKRSTQVLLVGFLVVGFVALGVGIYFDATRPTWLNGLNFVPNVWASITGFLIGAPFALVVLATFTVQREERAAKERVENLSNLAWQEFRDSGLKFASTERIETIRNNGARTYALYLAVFQAFQTYLKSARPERRMIDRTSEYGTGTFQETFWVTTDEDFNSFKREIGHYLEEWSQNIGAVMAQTDERELQLMWSEIQSNWATLDQFVRLQRLEQKLNWFDSYVNADMKNQLSSTSNLLASFARANSVDMRTALQITLEYNDLPKDAVDGKFLTGSSNNVGFPWMDRLRYSEEFGKAIEDLLNFRRVIEYVNGSDWLKSAD